MTEVSPKTVAFASKSARITPRILVVTSCTGEKCYKPENQLTLEDFKDSSRFQSRQTLLTEFSCPAREMYTGQQHRMAMEAVRLLRQALGYEAVDVRILSAGYGLIPEDKKIVPYEVTFTKMKGYEIDEWAKVLGIHASFEQAIVDYDLVFVLLGKKYLRSLRLPVGTQPNQTFIFFASQESENYIPQLAAKTFILPLSNPEAKRYRCALVGLKGFLLKVFAQSAVSEPELLQKVYEEPGIFQQVIEQQPVQLELSLGLPEIRHLRKSSAKTPKTKQSFQDYCRHILALPPANNKHLEMRYFIPEWDDRVDLGYDFKKDKFTEDRIAYIHDVYAHQSIYSSPNYDGILVSKVVVDKSKRKRIEIEKAGGIHKFIHFPEKAEIMGDCGAFGYIKEDEPPYKTDEILEYYHRLGFNYGVSIDHLIVGQFAQLGVREKRYELTQKNAREFIEKHKTGGYKFTPIGVAQGWSPETYADAVKALIEMGYDYIALGGLARAPSKKILEILQAVCPCLRANTRLHLFGVGRIDAVPAFRHLGVTSFDSASALRSAWLDSAANYHTREGKTYAAIRVPSIDRGGVRVKRVLEAGVAEKDTLKQLEQESLTALRKFDAGTLSLEETLEALLAYDQLLELPRDGKVNPEARAKRLSRHAQMYKELLENKPWQDCDCVICQKIGVEVVMFRGNDRNRRRGFHNTYVFYERFKEALLKSEKS